jgi:protein-disulfide isomerase
MKPNEQIGPLLADIPQRANALGHAEAPITLGYFADLQCPYCRDFSLQVLPSIIQRWVRPGTLRVHYRALQAATGDANVFVAQQVAVLAAGKQAKAWHFAETFYAEQGEENSGYVTDAYLRGVASQIAGLDLEQWAGDCGDQRLIEEIAGDEQAAEEAGVHGTPSLLIGATGGAMTRLSAPDSLADYSTRSAKSACSGAAGSSVSPVWAGENWMIVLDGAISQPKRSDAERCATGPAAGSPAATRTSASSCEMTISGDVSGPRTARRAGSRPIRAPRKSRVRQKRTTPALKLSPRSTRGTTRAIE